MEKLFPDEKDPQVILENLEAACVKAEELRFDRPFTPEQLLEMKDEFATQHVDLMQHQVEFDAIKKQYKTTMSPYKERIAKLVSNLKHKKETVTEMVFYIDDQEKRIMNIYDAGGNFISSRNLYPEERQLRINTNNIKSV